MFSPAGPAHLWRAAACCIISGAGGAFMEPFIQAAPEIDVEEIMAAIQKQIQEKKDAGLLRQSEIDEITEMELQPLPDFLEIPHIYEPILYPGFAENMAPPAALEEAIEEKGLLKGIMKKVRGLLAPWTRFMNRPLYVELKTGINDLQKKVPIILQSSEYIRLLHNAVHNLIVEASKLKTDEELLKTRMRILEDKVEFLENRQRALEKRLPGE
jgi:hypothetical protein